MGRVCAALILIQIKRIYLFSKRRPRQRRVVSGPDHGPRVDVVQRAARPRPTLTVADAPRKAGVLATRHASGNRSEIPFREKRQTAEDMRERNNIHNWIWRGHIQQLGPDFSRAGPPSPSLPGAVVVKGLDQGALTLHDAPSVCANTHLENQVDPAIPAVINRRAEGGARSSIVGRRRDEEDEVLSQ